MGTQKSDKTFTVFFLKKGFFTNRENQFHDQSQCLKSEPTNVG